MNLTYRKKRHKIENKDRETLRHISVTLDEILAVLSKPPNRAWRILELAAMVAGIVGALSIVDMVKNWFGG